MNSVHIYLGLFGFFGYFVFLHRIVSIFHLQQRSSRDHDWLLVDED